MNLDTSKGQSHVVISTHKAELTPETPAAKAMGVSDVDFAQTNR